jgi:hypothetical protein
MTKDKTFTLLLCSKNPKVKILRKKLSAGMKMSLLKKSITKARVFKIHTEDAWDSLVSTKKGQEYWH